MGAQNNSDMVSQLNLSYDFIKVNENLSALISSRNVFPYDSDQLYFFVREGYVQDPNLFSWRGEGYAKKVKVISEMIDG